MSLAFFSLAPVASKLGYLSMLLILELVWTAVSAGQLTNEEYALNKPNYANQN